MIDMTAYIAARSDQLNSDDLSGPLTITITKVTASPDASEQPVSIHFENDGGRPYKPCKTCRRIMVAIWGKDASKYVGRSMTLYRDAEVQFGGMKVGGIRISHMSDMDGDKTVALLVTRGRKAPFKIKPLKVAPPHDPDTGEIHDEPPSPRTKAEAWTNNYIGWVKDCPDTDALIALQTKHKKTLGKLEAEHADLFELAENAGKKRAGELQGATSDSADEYA